MDIPPLANFVTVDLHGQDVRGATEIVHHAVRTMPRAIPNGITVRYIVGRGIHSRDGPRIGPALVELLRNLRADFEVLDGSILVKFPKTRM